MRSNALRRLLGSPAAHLSLIAAAAILLMLLVDWRYRAVSRDNEALAHERLVERATALSALLADTVAATLGQVDVLHGLAAQVTEARMSGRSYSAGELERALDKESMEHWPDVAQLAGIGGDGGLLPIAGEIGRQKGETVTSGEDADETGIVAVGKGSDGRAYVLADRSCRESPAGWAHRAVGLFHELGSIGTIVGEANQGGDLIEATLRAVDPGIPYIKINAKQGKRLRAEPIAALYEQGRVSHVGLAPGQRLLAGPPRRPRPRHRRVETGERFAGGSLLRRHRSTVSGVWRAKLARGRYVYRLP